jgi:hypothetical protein
MRFDEIEDFRGQAAGDPHLSISSGVLMVMLISSGGSVHGVFKTELCLRNAASEKANLAHAG